MNVFQKDVLAWLVLGCVLYLVGGTQLLDATIIALILAVFLSIPMVEALGNWFDRFPD